MITPEILAAHERFVISTYGRFPLAFVRGRGARLWDAEGREYLDFAAGIGVGSLGHAHPALVEAIARQAATLLHVSNLYHTESQARVAERVAAQLGGGRCFFANSGAEANEALYKLARKFGHATGRYEILTAVNSFHGRTLAGISATGQDKIKKGFEPMVEGFRHVPFHDLAAVETAVSDKTVAILFEGVQGESGIHPATADDLLGLRDLCNRRGLLLMLDAVQDGMFRTGRFQSWQRLLEGSRDPRAAAFLPDALSMAKGIAGGVPMGLAWARAPYDALLGPGSHGSTFGGAPLACAAALAVFDTIEREGLADHARRMGERLLAGLRALASPRVAAVRGLGLMIGVELKKDIPALTSEGKLPSALFVAKLHALGLLAVPAGAQTIRFLPPLNVTADECDEAIATLARALAAL
ncbi:MAG: acetylornithine transaminase [Verrucomicrobiae bacterium]|nr:acetylornithine transaminase [Verrucomicrobiae bacterium]